MGTYLPLRAGLAPELARHVRIRLRHADRTAVARAQALRDPLRGVVVRGDAVDHLVPAQRGESPVHGRLRRLGRMAVAPGLGMEGPSDLVARPAIGPPGAGL